MFKTSSLLLVTIVAVALLAPPVSSQSRKTTLDDVATDVINLQSFVKEMQATSDKRNAETKAALEQILARFTSIDTRLQELGKSLAEIKAQNDKSLTEIQETRTAVRGVKDSTDRIEKLNLEEKLLGIQNALTAKGGIKDLIRDLQNTETALPTSRDAYDSAWRLLSQGFYDDAITELKDFLRAYPKDTRAPRASLDIGSAYVSQKKFEQAIDQFDLTIQNYPESDTKCTALYKKGLALEEFKQAAKAKDVFQSVAKDCVGTNEAGLAAEHLPKTTKPATPARGRGN